MLILFLVGHSFAGFARENQYFYMSDVSSANGLSHSHVKTIFKDSRGFLWFGTFDGLNRFDGYNAKRFLYDKTGSSLYQNKVIYKMLEDNKGFLWIAASGTDILRFDPMNESITILSLPLERESSTGSSFHVYDLIQDEKGILWFATSGGLFFLEPESDQVNFYSQTVIPGSAEIETICIDKANRLWIGTKGHGLYMMYDDHIIKILHDTITPFITDIFIDKNNTLLIATAGGGLFKYSHNTGISKQYLVKELPEGALPNLVNSIIPDQNSRFFLATYSGVYLFDSEKETFSDFSSELSFPRYPQNVAFNSLFLDDRNILWASTQSLGVYKYYLFHDAFSHIKPYPNEKSHAGNIIHSLIEISTGEFLIGTEAGLIVFSEKDAGSEIFAPSSVGNDPFLITNICKLSRDSLLVGTWNHGLWIFNPETRQFAKPESFAEGSGYSRIFDIFHDSKDNIWVGLHEEGLLKLNRNLEKVSHYISDGPDRQLSAISVRRILEDSDGNLWIGTLGSGIDILNPETGEFRNVMNDYITRGEISNNDILCLMEDSRGNIWIGTNGGGVNLYLTSINEFIHLTEKDGLINDVVFSILEDNNKNIWLQTNRGITRLSFYSGIMLPVSDTRDFGIEDGLPTTDYLFSNSYKSKEGRIYLPSREGLISFYPDNLIESDTPPDLVFTGIEINNRPINEYSKEISTYPKASNVAFLESIVLRHNLNRLSFEFAALDFFKPSDNQYMVKLDGFDDNWIPLANNRFISYINLPHGKYRMNVRASNSHNIWNEKGISLDIIISPPWWLTWWAFILYGVSVIGLFICTRYLIVRNERIKNKNKNEKLKLEKELELDRFKLDFFTKITHEIRTPITLIMGPIEKMLQSGRNDETEKKYFQILKSNSDKLYDLTNQILDFRKIDEGKFTLNKATDDPIPLIQSIVQRFYAFSESKKISLFFNPRIKALYWDFDSAVIDRIISNLITNAIKFTSEGGMITVSCYPERSANFHDIFIIEVSDNGKGITEDELNEIFKPFYQAKTSNSADIPGTGIGLALVKELVDLHEGKIEVESKVGEGSRFRIYFKNELKQIRIKDEKSFPVFPVKCTTSTGAQSKLFKREKPRILIVEDNTELNEFLLTILNDDYRVYSGINGLEGLAKARQLIPDLIISDIMMPEMNGLEMCRELKDDNLTCHIPIILLTVMTGESGQISGFEAGGDDYIAKPFNPSILLIKVRNLLTLKNNMREQFAKSFMLLPSLDKETIDPLIDKMMSFIHANLDDPELDIKKMQKEIGIGRSQLFLKIKNITGMTVAEMIQGIRLKKAYEFLSSGNYIVSEAAYMAGFKNLSHFTRIFKKHFGQLPSDIATKQKIL
jgi:signal transduction histidine kinase/AraC-like DNA-binding protein/streptogramin lyase